MHWLNTLQVTPVPSALFFTTSNWDDLQTVTLSAVDDAIVEGTHSAAIQHFATGGGYDGIPSSSVLVTITDNDGGGGDHPGRHCPRLSFRPIDDSWVRQDDPTANHGDDNRIEVDQSPVKDGLLRFNVSGIAGRTVLDAILRLNVRDGSPGGGRFLGAAHNIWQEDVVTWNTAPAASAPFLGQLGSVSPGQWVELDLIGWFGLPTTTRAILDSNPRILRIWVWISTAQSWLVDSNELPDGLRTTIVIERGQGLFIVSSRATTLEVTVAG